MKTHLLKLVKAICVLALLVTVTNSCKKETDVIPTPAEEPVIEAAVQQAATTASTKPTILGIRPAKGSSGDLVSIVGTNFSTVVSQNVVKFNGVQTQLKSATKTELVAYAPSGAKTGPITLKVGTNAVITGPVFTYIPRVSISTVTPSKAKPGTIVTVTGANFSTVKINNVVMFGGVGATVATATTTKLTVTVPAAAKSGMVTVSVAGGATVTGPAFTVILPAPTIKSITPATGKVGASVTIAGTNFSPVKTNNVIMFGGVAATITAATTTNLTATVPAGAKTGKITLSVSGGAAITGPLFTVIIPVPTITSITPPTGKTGATITINGTNFSTVATNNVVKLGGVQATVTSATATKLMVTVPAGAKTGKITLSVLGGTTISGPVFTYIPPVSISAITPATGKAGAMVTITGTSFSTVKTSNVVKFGGVAATVLTATATKLTVTVPAGAKTGAITIAVSGGTVITGPVFTVIEPAPTITSITPATGKTGDVVTINGTNFSTVKTSNVVKFGGVAATIATATATKLTVTVPAGAKTGKITLSVLGSTAVTGPNFTVTVTTTPGTWQEMGFTTSIQESNISATAGGKSFMFTGGSYPNYLYYTADGSTYLNVYDNLPFDKTKHLEIHLITADANASGGPTYYITTNLGVAKTTDGTHWTEIFPTGDAPNYGFTGIIARNNNVFLLTGGFLYASHDSGSTWEKTYVATAGGLDYITSDGVGKYWYAVNASGNYLSGTTKMLYRSGDYGKTWTPASGATGVYFYGGGNQDFLNTSGYTIFCLFSNEPTRASIADQRLYRSTNLGDTWTKVTDDAYYFVKTFGDYVVYGGADLKVSVDGGINFKTYTIPDGYAIGGVTRADGYIYLLCYSRQGVFKSRIFRQKI
jgi:hypothetical protein